MNAFEQSGLVAMAAPALFLRHVTAPAWDNAFINFDNRSWFPAPNYVVMKLYWDHFASQLLKVDGNAAGLSVDAAKSADGKRVVVKMVNPSDGARQVSVELGRFAPGAAKLSLVAPNSLSARNTLEHPDLVAVTTGRVATAGSTATVSLPKFAVGVLEITSAPNQRPKSSPHSLSLICLPCGTDSRFAIRSPGGSSGVRKFWNSSRLRSTGECRAERRQLR